MNDYESLKTCAFEITNSAIAGDTVSELAARESLIELVCKFAERNGISPELLEILADFQESSEMSELLYRLGIAQATHLGKNAATIRLSLADLLSDYHVDKALELIYSIAVDELDDFEQNTLATLTHRLLTIKK